MSFREEVNYPKSEYSVSLTSLTWSPFSNRLLYRSVPAAPPLPPPAILAPVLPPPGLLTFRSPKAVGFVSVTGMDTGDGFGALTGDGFGRGA